MEVKVDIILSVGEDCCNVKVSRCNDPEGTDGKASEVNKPDETKVDTGPKQGSEDNDGKESDTNDKNQDTKNDPVNENANTDPDSNSGEEPDVFTNMDLDELLK